MKLSLPSLSELYISTEHFLSSHETLVVGLATYAGGMLLLNNLEKIRTENGFASTFFDDYTFQGLNKAQIESPWIVPIMLDNYKPIPQMEDLEEQDQLVGTRAGAMQFITLSPLKNIHRVQELSTEWSNLYNTSVFMYKKKIF